MVICMNAFFSFMRHACRQRQNSSIFSLSLTFRQQQPRTNVLPFSSCRRMAPLSCRAYLTGRLWNREWRVGTRLVSSNRVLCLRVIPPEHVRMCSILLSFDYAEQFTEAERNSWVLLNVQFLQLSVTDSAPFHAWEKA